MATTFQFVDGNTRKVVREVPNAEVPEHLRFAYFRGGSRVDRREDADQRVELVKAVLFRFDRTGRLTSPRRAYNGFLKLYDAAGNQVIESFIEFEAGAYLTTRKRFGGEI